jgi:hypothetical protein
MRPAMHVLTFGKKAILECGKKEGKVPRGDQDSTALQNSGPKTTSRSNSACEQSGCPWPRNRDVTGGI